MKNIKTIIGKCVKYGFIVGTAYVAGRITCFVDMAKKYEDVIAVDSLEMGILSERCKYAGMGWCKPKK